tara:strand:- start:43 stop:555 length:513 start_codon:yes stop_codon:yes gene_type:complete
MENIVITYDNVLKSFNQDKKILSVSYEHKDRKVCFHSNQREILYSIRDYFKSVLKKDFTTYTETSYIKKLTICYFTIPHNPKKDKIIELYKQNYFYRLSLQLHYFRKIKKLQYKDYEKLIQYEKFNLTEYYPIKNIELPDCLIKYIMLYLKPTIKQYYDVRDLYKKYKKL